MAERQALVAAAIRDLEALQPQETLAHQRRGGQLPRMGSSSAATLAWSAAGMVSDSNIERSVANSRDGAPSANAADMASTSTSASAASQRSDPGQGLPRRSNQQPSQRRVSNLKNLVLGDSPGPEQAAGKQSNAADNQTPQTRQKPGLPRMEPVTSPSPERPQRKVHGVSGTAEIQRTSDAAKVQQGQLFRSATSTRHPGIKLMVPEQATGGSQAAVQLATEADLQAALTEAPRPSESALPGTLFGFVPA